MTPRPRARPDVASTRCPFLVEETAQYCQLAPSSKLVPSREHTTRDQCCSTDAWRSCAWLPRTGVPRDRPDQSDASSDPVDYCPFLGEMLACACAADSSSKLIPRTRLAVQRCLADAHRYCDVFIEHAVPRAPVRIADVPAVALAPNHMWLDVGPDGSCHVGVDALLVHALGRMDDVTFLSLPGRGSPSVVFSVAGTALPMTFPQAIEITGVNSALRRHLDRMAVDPYGRAWLYEGWTLEPDRRPEHRGTGPRLRRGPEAEIWMATEIKRLSRHVHEVLSRGGHLGPILNDGGEVVSSLPLHLDRDELVEVFTLFFSGASG